MDIKKLRSTYSMVQVRNLRPVQTTIPLEGGDSLTLQPYETAKISTASLTQIPSPREVEFINPTLSMLVKDGILEKGAGSKPSAEQSGTTPSPAPVATSSPRSQRKPVKLPSSGSN